MHSEDEIINAINILKSTPINVVQNLGYHFQINDYYSPLNSFDFLKNNIDLWKNRDCNIDWDIDYQISIAKIVGDYVLELKDIPIDHSSGKIEYCWNNPMWNNADALVQYGIIRHYKPKKIVEIGCGWSSLLMNIAVSKNETLTDVVQVEPFPNIAIFKLLPKNWLLCHSPLQRAPIEIFKSLKSGDICFYDGSHCSKAGSDVNWFFFEILPVLAPGVIIHIHDIFLPNDYPDEWIFERGQTWNEQYLLHAFLMNNPHYKILIANSYLYKSCSNVLDSFYKGIQPSYGCSFWMQKIK
jgi:predicted O-methyltransferase YrrM